MKRLVVLALAPGVHVVQWMDGGSPVEDVLVVDRELAAPGWQAVADVLATSAGIAVLRAVASRGDRAVPA